MRLGPTLVGAGALMSSYRVQVPLLARRCGSCANERLPLRPPEGAALFQSRASLPHALIFNPGISVEYYMGPAAAAAALFPGRYPRTTQRPLHPPGLVDTVCEGLDEECGGCTDTAGANTQWGVGSDETETHSLTPPPLMSCVLTHMLAACRN